MIPLVLNDGGRSADGYKGQTSDCVTRAIAIVTGRPYAEVYALVNEAGDLERADRKGRKSSARTGVRKKTTRLVMKQFGLVWTPTMAIGQGCKVHLTASELPAGRIIVSVTRHVAAVIDGVLHDTHDCSRNGTRCVYGYWSQP